jgi:hypothetical protein
MDHGVDFILWGEREKREDNINDMKRTADTIDSGSQSSQKDDGKFMNNHANSVPSIHTQIPVNLLF